MDGLSERDAADEFGVSKSTVHRDATKTRDQLLEDVLSGKIPLIQVHSRAAA